MFILKFASERIMLGWHIYFNFQILAINCYINLQEATIEWSKEHISLQNQGKTNDKE